MKSYRLGLTTVTFRKKTPAEICELAAKNNIRYLEWGTDVHVPTVEKAKEVRTLCDSAQIETVSLGTYHRVGIPSETPFSETLEIAKTLGAPRIRLWLGRKSSVAFTTEERSALIDETKALLAMAKPYGIELSFEFHRKTLNDTGKSCLAFLKEINNPALSTYWQPFFHETPEKDHPFADDRDNLMTVLPYISATHVFSWNEAAERFPFAYHKEAWRSFLTLLEDSPCQDLIMEFVVNDSETQLKEDLHELRTLLEEIQ